MSALFDLSGSVVQCCDAPFTVSPEGVVNGPTADADNQDAEFIPFDDIQTVGVVLDTIQINGRPFAKVPSAIFAAEIAGLLQQLQSARRKERDKVIRSVIRDRLSVPDIKWRWQLFREETKRVREASLLAAAWLFVVSPVTLLLFGPLASWPYLLAGLFGGALATSVLYFRAHRRLFTIAAADRWTHAISMTLFPVAALRACDRLTKDLFYAFEPVAVVAAFCDTAATTTAIRPVMFDLSHSRGADTSSGNATACRVWHRAVLREEISTLVATIDVDLVTGPVPEDGSVRMFCPRCHTQYGERTMCAACGDVALVPLAVPGPLENAFNNLTA
jgi:hypothetical protein